MKKFTHDLAISAVPFDTMLVADLSARVTSRSGLAPYWRGSDTSAELFPDGAAEAVGEGRSRIALVLHQRLWGHDAATRADEAPLRARVRSCADSVLVVTLDDAPVPDWMAKAPRCALSKVGVDGAVESALDAINARGGSLNPLPKEEPAAAAFVGRWGDTPAPFLAQSRALSSLRREFDALEAGLSARVAGGGIDGTAAELNASPRRLVVQVGPIGISFSWLAGRTDTVAEGRLLVIEWDGIVSSKRGMGATQTAKMIRERVYRAEATGPDSWRWRADDDSGESYSSDNLAGQWLSAAFVAAQGSAEHVAS